MRTRLALTFVVLALAASGQRSSSQPPTPTPAKASQTKQQQTRAAQTEPKPDDQPAKKPPATVQQTTPEVAVRYQQRYGQEDKGHTSPDWPSWSVAFFTFGLLIFSVFQWLTMRRQAKLMSDQLGEMETTSADTHDLAIAAGDTATAAKAQAQSLKGAIRAWVSVGKIQEFSDLDRRPNVITISIKNTGLSPALDLVVRTTMGYSESDGIAIFPDDPPYTPVDAAEMEALRSKGALGPGERKTLTAPMPQIDEDTLLAIKESRRALYVYGRIEYADIFEELHVTTFASMYYVHDRSWGVCGNHNQQT